MRRYWAVLISAFAAAGLICWWRTEHGKKRQLAGEHMGRVLCGVCGKPQDNESAELFLRGAVQTGEGMVERLRRAGG